MERLKKIKNHALLKTLEQFMVFDESMSDAVGSLKKADIVEEIKNKLFSIELSNDDLFMNDDLINKKYLIISRKGSRLVKLFSHISWNNGDKSYINYISFNVDKATYDARYHILTSSSIPSKILDLSRGSGGRACSDRRGSID